MSAPRSVLAGLIGAGIQASRTPALHEREGDAQGIRYLYRLIDLDPLGKSADDLEFLLAAASDLGFTGLNVTFPCKQAIIPLLDDLSAEARGIGAVNTVVLRDGRRIGHNTDCLGFAEGFRRGLAGAPRQRVVQMGAGGAGAAVAHALLAEGVERLVLFDVDPARAQALADNLNQHFGAPRALAGSDLAGALGDAQGLVNTTPVGMAKLPGMPVPAELLRADLWVAEVIYFPLETELLRQARALGCRTLDGGTMAVFQAVKAFELFSGVTADAARMQAHFASLGDELAPLSHQGERGPESGTDVAQYRLANHPPVPLANLGVVQVGAKDPRHGVAIGHPVEAERTDQHVHVERLQPGAEHPFRFAAAENLGDALDDRAVDALHQFAAGDVLALVDVLDADDAHEIHVPVVVVEAELHQLLHRLGRRQRAQPQGALDTADVAVELLQHGLVELLLAAEVVIDHPLRGMRALGDGVHPRTREALGDELVDGGAEDVLAGFLGIVLASLAARSGFLHDGGIRLGHR